MNNQKEDLIDELMGAYDTLARDSHDNPDDVLQDLLDLELAEQELSAWELVNEE